MKCRILNSIAALLFVAANTIAQTITVADYEAGPGWNETLKVNISDASAVTAVQFNLSLPKGVVLDEQWLEQYGHQVFLGNASNGHSLSVKQLGSGDWLIVVYGLNLQTLNDGTLVEIMTMATDDVATSDGRLYNVRTATADAVSKACDEVAFSAVVKTPVVEVTGITLSQTTATLTEGESLTLTATVAPDNATDKTVAWSSSNAAVATVDNNGVVTAVAEGTATITAKANDGSGVTASCVVTVERPATISIAINKYGSGTYSSKYALDFSAVEGLKAYAATGYNCTTGVVTLTRVMTAQAGVGLFVKGEANVTYDVPVLATSSDNSLNMLVATVERTSVNKLSDDGVYANYRFTTKTGVATPMFYEIADGYTMSAGKAYLQIPVVWMPTTTNAISYRLEEGTTGMEDVENVEEQASPLYDLMGRRVTVPMKGTLYLRDGKKFIY